MELEFYRFINDNGIEYRWDGEENVIIWIPFYLLDDFVKIVNISSAEDGVECTLQEGCLALDTNGIYSLSDIDLEKIFDKV